MTRRTSNIKTNIGFDLCRNRYEDINHHWLTPSRACMLNNLLGKALTVNSSVPGGQKHEWKIQALVGLYIVSKIETLRQHITVLIITTSMVKQVQKFPKRDLILCIAISPDGALRGRPLIKGDSPHRLNRASYGATINKIPLSHKKWHSWAAALLSSRPKHKFAKMQHISLSPLTLSCLHPSLASETLEPQCQEVVVHSSTVHHLPMHCNNSARLCIYYALHHI